MSIRVFSYGGGVQSTAALVLASQGKIDYQTFLFCNVGDDSENPETLKYLNEIAMPYAAMHGIQLIELQKTRFGEPITLYQMITRPGSRSVGIPVRLSNGSPASRSCTVDFKINVVEKWLREHGGKIEGAVVGLGISLDEWHRARNDSGVAWKKLDYPLLDLRLTRQDCSNIIANAGLPIPDESSCFFCPFHKIKKWQEMRQNQPQAFWKSSELETFLNERQARLGKEPVWLTDRGRPLAMATTDYQQPDLFEDDEQAVCESGYCMI
jgi:hypothetical protein